MHHEMYEKLIKILRDIARTEGRALIAYRAKMGAAVGRGIMDRARARNNQARNNYNTRRLQNMNRKQTVLRRLHRTTIR